MEVRIYDSPQALGMAAAQDAKTALDEAIRQRGEATLVLATGNSQIPFLDALTSFDDLDWSRIEAFHMDEYLGIEADHPASFRRYLRERVEENIHPRAFHYLEGDALEPNCECDRYERLLRSRPPDLCCLGIGENGHIAFNDPPVADFHDDRWVKIVKLDEACRRQQVGEGHFPDMDAVPRYALTMTVPALCAARKMLCIAPEERKASAVKAALTGPVSTDCPASILREQAHCTLYLDRDSSSLLAIQ